MRGLRHLLKYYAHSMHAAPCCPHFFLSRLMTASMSSKLLFSTGAFSLEVPGGSYKVAISKTNFVPLSTRIYVTAGKMVKLPLALSPKFSSKQARFILTWGASPKDLDMYLTTPSGYARIITVAVAIIIVLVYAQCSWVVLRCTTICLLPSSEVLCAEGVC